jgi:hypothetical protein
MCGKAVQADWQCCPYCAATLAKANQPPDIRLPLSERGTGQGGNLVVGVAGAGAGIAGGCLFGIMLGALFILSALASIAYAIQDCLKGFGCK